MGYNTVALFLNDQADRNPDGPEAADRIRELEAAIRAAQLIRPDNWDDGDDPQQEAAWRVVDIALAGGVRWRAGEGGPGA